MDFGLSEELQMLKDMVRDFVDEKIAPFADEWEETMGRNTPFPLRRGYQTNG